MKIKYLVVFWVLILVLSTCSGNGQTTIVPVSEPNEVAVISTVTEAAAPLPSDTPLSNTPTDTIASIPPIPTVTPENFVLAESGSDIADVRISYPDEDIAIIDFDYRVDTQEKQPNQQIVILLLLPNSCRNDNSPPMIQVSDASGEGRLFYKQVSQGLCNVPYFDLAIKYMSQVPGNITLIDVYQERINQPLAVTRNIPSVTSQTLTIKNFSFERTGGWSGIFSFEYAFSPEIPIDTERYRFALNGMGIVYVCEFYAMGPIITEPEGRYTIAIDFYASENFRITDSSCLTKYSTLTYDKSVLNLDDLRSSDPTRVYRRAVDLVITLDNAP